MILQKQVGVVVERDIFLGIHLDLLLIGGLESRITLIRKERQCADDIGAEGYEVLTIQT